MSQSDKEKEIDRELVERFRGGDQNAAAELHERYVRQMLQKVRRRLMNSHNRATYDSSGIVQEGFRSFFSAVGKPEFDPPQWNIAGLLGRIVFCKTMVGFRRQNKVISVAPESLAMIVEAAIDLAGQPEQEQLVGVCLQEAINGCDLEEFERSILVIYLDEDDDRTCDEIAEACRCSIATVRATIKRFESLLAQRLEAEERAEKLG
ncbi:RNA polymerase sigma factor RpoE [Symmachiella dynata]|uniref:RNA polymerase sigma factor RpoE n=1 Tax=Symmachiella dynata TaxID=2527995 RepID=A0A517ZRU8_9PLAN|nr:sigma-70 family RNA polymerase sigma factor [Symmachiella dynata]QDU45198.1 RNA polymerase sigma factor RpoE [Symmachiella dynata]